MKKTVLFVAAASLIFMASGCGCCRGWFGNRVPLASTVASPVVSSCAPSCAPACSPQCDSGCSSCNDGGAVSYGYDGSSIPTEGEMTFPSGTTYGP